MGFFMSNEQISEAKIRQAIWMLKVNKTKKSVCEHLGIPYNTKKLEKIIQDFRDSEAREAALRLAAKKSEISIDDKKVIASLYINGEAQSAIAKQFFITAPRVKKILLELGVPIRAKSKKGEANTSHIVQDLNIKFSVNEKVFYARENTLATIIEVYDEEYAEKHRQGLTRRVELVKWKPSLKFPQPAQGVHYEVYYDLEDGSSWKLQSLKSHIKKIEDLIAETGQETYAIYTEGEFSCKKLFVYRSELFPVIHK